MADRGRGGPRQPRNPAAVSAPGSGARTDGGAGSKSQPLRVPSGGGYGQRQAATGQQQGAPLASGGPATPSGGPPAGAGGQGLPPMDVFGPTSRPGESPTAGIGQEGLFSPEDPDLPIRIMYQMYPHPSLARLLEN
jgi:hypothetical protein